MSFNFEGTDVPGVTLIKPKVFPDDRGFFMEAYKKSDFDRYGIDANFVQDNQSKSKRGVIRGLHYQTEPYGQGKLVRCIKGRIFDVAVDIRKESPTFGKWVGYELTDENKLMLWIPKGFAHGFLALSDDAEIIYKVSGSEYSPKHDAGIIWNDPDINISWPLDEIENVYLSEKDEKLPRLKDAKINFYYGR